MQKTHNPGIQGRRGLLTALQEGDTMDYKGYFIDCIAVGSHEYFTPNGSELDSMYFDTIDDCIRWIDEGCPIYEGEQA